MIAPTNFYECFELLHGILTKTEIKICKAFLWFFKQEISGNHKKTNPSVNKISEIAKCCPRTVNGFIKKYENIIINHKNTWNPEKKKRSSNSYGFNDSFFEFMILLDECGYLKNWTKNTQNHVIEKLAKNEWFMHEILLANGTLMNNEIAYSFFSKLRSIKNFFLLRKYRYKDLHEDHHIKKEEKKNFGILEGVPTLTYSDKKNLVNNFGHVHLRYGVEVFNHVESKDKIPNVKGFIYMQARKSTLKMMRVK